MRFSDWSSDVCSSDLHPFDGKHAAAGPFGRGENDSSASLLPCLLLRSGDCVDRLCVSAGKLGGRAIAPGLFRPGLVRADETAVRSEEHTSELQSLMRPSSAVFCLKKTKKHNKQINKVITTRNITK